MFAIFALFLWATESVHAQGEFPPTQVQLIDQMPVQYIRTPGFPDKNYPPRFYVSYNITYDDGFTLQITLEKFFLQKSDNCAKDFLDITDGKKIQTLCGLETGKVVEFEGGAPVTLAFTTDSFIEDAGFLIKLAIVKPPCKCGQSNGLGAIKTRIFGGEELSPKVKYPWLVSIGNEKGDHLCGGTLISDRYILTAAHCFKDEKGLFNSALNTRVTLGAHSLKLDPKKVVQPFDVILHDEYVNTGFNIRNDIALVKLAEPVTFTKKIRPVCLPSLTMNGPYSNLSVAGWGKTPKAEVSDVPLEVFIPEVDFETCKKFHGFRIKKGKVVCAGGMKGRDACSGDSGGPLMEHSPDGRLVYLVGVVSFGDSCGEVGKFGVYTKVNEYLEWIEENTRDSATCPSEASLDSPSVCGVPKVILGSNSNSTIEFPWMAAIGYNGALVGGGALVSANYVLTSASNLRNQTLTYAKEKLMVVLGTKNLSQSSPTTRMFNVVEIIKSDTDKMALLKLSGSADEISKLYNPICLPAQGARLDSFLDFSTAGWGRTRPGGQSSSMMKLLVFLTRLDPKMCSYERGIICAGSPFSGLCQGDEGAPLMYFDNGKFFVGGVLGETTPDTCSGSKPNAFADILKDLQWINKTANL